MEQTQPDAADADGPQDDREHRQVVLAVAVTVTRTGGLAGMKRTWRAQPPAEDAPQWIALLEECPWDAADPKRPITPTGADRYMWHVDARCGDDERAAALADPEVQGPWRDLIDAVRSLNGRRVGTS